MSDETVLSPEAGRTPAASLAITAHDYMARARAARSEGRLVDAETLLAEGRERFPEHPGIAVDYAWLAHDRGHWEAATKRWDAARACAPDDPTPILGTSIALLRTGRVDDAERLLASSLDRFPDHADLSMRHGWVALTRGDPETALQRWELVCARHPDRVEGYRGLARALEALGRAAEADQTLRKARERFGEVKEVMLASAQLAVDRGRWDEAFERWSETRRRFPDDPTAAIGAATSLRQLGRLDEADQLHAEALERFPDNAVLRVGYAAIAAMRGDWDEAVCRWRSVSLRYPENPDGPAGEGRAWAGRGCFAEAEILLADAVARFPQSRHPAMEYATVAGLADNWSEAVRRWRAARDRFPNDAAINEGLAKAEYNLRLREANANAQRLEARTAAIEAAGAIQIEHAPPAETSAVDDTLAELMLNFESLGDNCEFGFVQRRCGVEPIGLLRWSLIGPDELLAALENRFEGVGQPEHTILTMQEGDYRITDTRYDLHLHTFIPATERDREGILKRTRPRVRYLCRELIKDLTAGKKIFIYKTSWSYYLSDEYIYRLHRLIREYGPSTVFCVRKDAAAHGKAAGTVEKWADGLLVGYMEQFYRADRPAEIELEPWLTVCRKAYALWSVARGEQASHERPGSGPVPAAPGPTIPDTSSTAASADVEPLADLMQSFESLGDNCEFGFVQRHCGAEPLGLFRWSFIRPPGLLSALENNLDGIGDPSQSRLSVEGNDYRLLDRRYGLNVHTHTPPDHGDERKLFKQACRRIEYLKKGLLAELENSNKIFVFKHRGGELEDEFVHSLYRAIRSYGQNTFLFVRKASDGQIPGNIEKIADGLLVGYVRQFYLNDPAEIDFYGWLSVCRKAHALWQAERDDNDSVVRQAAAQ